MAYLTLLAAIFCEVAATSALKLSSGFSRLLPTLCALALYGIAFYLLSLTVRSVSVGLAYAIWSGIGIILISLIGIVAFREMPDSAAIVGIGLILSGVLVIALLSRSIAH